LGYDLEDKIVLEENKDLKHKIKFKHPFPSPISVRTYLTKFCDIQGTLRKKTLKEISEFVGDSEVKRKFLHLSSNEGKFDFETQITKEFKSLYDIITENKVRVPITQLIKIASLIPPRYYTIASSNVQHPKSVHICSSILALPVPNKKRYGLCSAYFNRSFIDFKNKQPVRTRILAKESTFLLPQDLNMPVIMIGPGAGIAPFRGFVQEKETLEAKNENKFWGELTLLFGCRNRNSDYLYKEELEKYQSSGVLKNLWNAFSREQEKKVYVQDLFDSHKEELIQLIFEKNATVYICGATEMGKAVLKKLSQLAAAHYKCNLIQSALKVEELEKSKKVIKELWG